MSDLKVIQEVTEWETDTPNHTYAVVNRRSKMIAYMPANSIDVVVFSKPLTFSTTRRKFVEVKDETILYRFRSALNVE